MAVELSSGLPWVINALMCTAEKVFDIARRRDGSILRRILDFCDYQAPPSPFKPIDGVTSTDISVDLSRNLWFRLFVPVQPQPSMPVIFYIHGGGFAVLSPASVVFDGFCRSLARELKAVVVSVNYRLTPEHRWPTQYDDCFDVLRFIDSTSLPEIPKTANFKHCFLAGDSAGANAAHHVALLADGYGFSKLGLAGLISLQPFFGGEETLPSEERYDDVFLIRRERTDWLWKAFLPESANRDHPACHVFGPNAPDITGIKYPATMVVIGGYDPLQDWQRRYVKWLQKAGKEAYSYEYTKAVHAFYGFPNLPQSGLLIEDVREFVEKQVSKIK